MPSNVPLIEFTDGKKYFYVIFKKKSKNTLFEIKKNTLAKLPLYYI